MRTLGYYDIQPHRWNQDFHRQSCCLVVSYELPFQLMLQSIRECNSYLKTRSKMTYDRRHSIKELEPLVPGEQVWIPDLKRQGTIHGTAKYLRSLYLSEAATLRRNRRQVIKVLEEESRKWVPVKVTNIQGAADTARPVVSGEAKRSMVAEPFDQDTPPRLLRGVTILRVSNRWARRSVQQGRGRSVQQGKGSM
ncbi:hypothetical protein PR048_015392 [Dryococelus australis]|uniref:Uncharacterized protein n=1 Tax=Dryococelus australis TaxID=614101 RepID=A0ABQ9HGU1_9NEOP|nr:hypothetical protein PR048_015392 [Dryococelus australis]